MYKSLAAALLVAATEAATTTYKHDFTMAVPTGKTGTAVTGAVDAKVTKTDCTINMENTAKATKVKTTQESTAKDKLSETGDLVEVVCSWKEGSAIWWAQIGQYKLEDKAKADKYLGTTFQHKLTKEPTATTFATAKIVSDGITTGKYVLATAHGTTLSPDISKATAQGSTKLTTSTYTLDATGKIFKAIDEATYTGTDESTAKGVFDNAKSGAAKTLQGFGHIVAKAAAASKT